MKLFTLEKPPAEPAYPKLTSAEYKSLWKRIGVSVIYAGVTLALFCSLFYTLLGILGLSAVFVLFAGLGISLILPHWHFRQQPHLKACLVLSAIYFLVTFIIVVLQLVVFNAPGLFIIFSLATGVALSIVLPHFRYREGIYSLLIFAVWFILMSVAMPSLMKQYRLAMVANTITPYPALEFTETYYSPGSFPDVSGGAGYSYKTTNPKEDFLNMKEFYQGQLSKKGWGVCGGYDFSDYGDALFCKGSDSIVSVRVSYQANPDKVKVGLSY